MCTVDRYGFCMIEKIIYNMNKLVKLFVINAEKFQKSSVFISVIRFKDNFCKSVKNTDHENLYIPFLQVLQLYHIHIYYII